MTAHSYACGVRRLLTPKWVLVHVAVVVLVIVFLRLGWWQVTRAADGNLLSYGYALQWPAFAVFVVFVWIKEMRLARRGPGAGTVWTDERSDEGAERGGKTVPVGPRTRASEASADDTAEDPELAAYNRYLAWLNANPGASPRDYPG
jgi:hypothetical protein